MSTVSLAPAGVGAGPWLRPLQRRIAFTDAFVVVMVMVLAHGVHFGWDPFAWLVGPAAPERWWVTVLISLVWISQLFVTHSYDRRIVGQGPEEYQRVATAGWRTFALVATIGFLTQWSISRGYLVFALPIGTLVLFGYRRAWRVWITQQRDAGNLRQRVVLVGPPRMAEQMVARLRGVNVAHAYEVVGICLPGDTAMGGFESIAGVPVLGRTADAARAAQEADADFVILAGAEELSLHEARQIEWALEETKIGLIVTPTVADVAMPRVAVSQVAGLPLMHVVPPRFSGPARVMKGVADRVGAALILAIAAVPMMIIAITVKVSSPGPVLFRQVRVGLNNRPFAMLKFRSMYADAEARRAEVLSVDDGNGVLSKRKDDPRITPVGRVLRRYSLDELPQLINVIRGDMSLVGPRPPLPSEMELWEAHVARRQRVKPGLTGLWQVSGRSDLSWEESVQLDLHYTQNWSLGLDALIMMRTAWAVVRKKGAY